MLLVVLHSSQRRCSHFQPQPLQVLQRLIQVSSLRRDTMTYKINTNPSSSNNLLRRDYSDTTDYTYSSTSASKASKGKKGKQKISSMNKYNNK